MAQIYLVRHTTVNIHPGICYGATDVPLASTFPEEAQNIKVQLQNIHFNYIFSSPLSRCTQLSELLAPKNYIIDDRLKELNFGDWEGKSWDEIYNTSYGKKWMNNYLSLSCPNGESYMDVYNRIRSFLSTINFDNNILIITHGGVIRIMNTIINKMSNKSLFEMNINFGGIVIIQLN